MRGIPYSFPHALVCSICKCPLLLHMGLQGWLTSVTDAPGPHHPLLQFGVAVAGGNYCTWTESSGQHPWLWLGLAQLLVSTVAGSGVTATVLICTDELNMAAGIHCWAGLGWSGSIVIRWACCLCICRQLKDIGEDLIPPICFNVYTRSLCKPEESPKCAGKSL